MNFFQSPTNAHRRKASRIIKEKFNKYRATFQQLRPQFLDALNAPVELPSYSRRYRKDLDDLRKKIQKLLTIMRAVPESLRLTILKENEQNYAPNELTYSQIVKDINDLVEEITAVLNREPGQPEPRPEQPESRPTVENFMSRKVFGSRKRKRVDETKSTSKSIENKAKVDK